jgi:hypothetical protein
LKNFAKLKIHVELSLKWKQQNGSSRKVLLGPGKHLVGKIEGIVAKL